ncbi:MAG: undecaprenyl-diphosphate phosphatase, partial [Pyrinomonadaceae bacterium]
MTILQAIILGIVQGITEFLPISSTAHLIFAGRLLGLYANADTVLRAEQTTATIAVMQIGTLVAILIYFAQDILNIAVSFIRDHMELVGRFVGSKQAVNDGRRFKLSSDARLGWLVIIGTLPVAIVGLVFKHQIEGTFTKNLWVIAIMMILIALALAMAERIGRQRTVIEDLQVSDALAVGSAQVLALIPGASRSGSTIMGGLFAGQTRETAARFSFLL